jgi:hypothetical protein
MNYILNTTHYTLHTINYILNTTHYTQHTINYILNTTHYTLRTIHYTLNTTQYILSCDAILTTDFEIAELNPKRRDILVMLLSDSTGQFPIFTHLTGS